MTSPALAPVAWECVLHVLAHAPLNDPASLHDARYLRHVHARLPAHAWNAAADDGTLVATLHARAGADAWALQCLAVMHRDGRQLRMVSRRPLHDVGDGEVAERWALKALRALATRHEALVEVVRADVGLAAGAYLDAYESVWGDAMRRALEEVRAAFERAAEVAPALKGVPVYLSSVLGARGRALGAMPAILVGAPLAWNELAPEHAVIQALHERAVMLAEGGGGDARSRYVVAEWRALRAVERLVAGTALAEARARWASRFDLSGVAREAEERGEAGEGAVDELVARLRGG